MQNARPAARPYRTRQRRAIAGHTPLPFGGPRTWRTHLAATRADAAAPPVASIAAATPAGRGGVPGGGAAGPGGRPGGGRAAGRRAGGRAGGGGGRGGRAPR